MKKTLVELAIVLTLLSPILVQAQEIVNLPVPFIPQIPDGRWISPWKDACEEASIIMIEEYYLGKKATKLDVKKQMQKIFVWENRVFGGNADTDAVRTAKIINDYSSFSAKIKRNPTLDDIKNELQAGRPVISFHYGFGLKNSRIPFKPTGSSFHVMAIVGFDDQTEEFIVNEPALYRPSGLDYRYNYATIMDTLHDFNHQKRKVNGTPVVLFTAPKVILKTSGSPRLYLLSGTTKRLIVNNRLFKKHRWSKQLIKTVSHEELDRYLTGKPLNQ